jgi:hypothetical protein
LTIIAYDSQLNLNFYVFGPNSSNTSCSLFGGANWPNPSTNKIWWKRVLKFRVIQRRVLMVRITRVNDLKMKGNTVSAAKIQSRASAASLSTLLRTTLTAPMEKCEIRVPAKLKTRSQPNSIKFCLIDNVCIFTWCTNMNWNRFIGGGSTCGCNKRTCHFLELYLTFFFVRPYKPDGSTDSHAQWLTRSGLGEGFAFRWWRRYKIALGIASPLIFHPWMLNFQPNQYTQITFERYKVDYKFQWSTYIYQIEVG